jgi:hypothetical protein
MMMTMMMTMMMMGEAGNTIQRRLNQDSSRPFAGDTPLLLPYGGSEFKSCGF